MANNLLKSFIHFGALLMMLLCSMNNYADGHITVMTNILEEVRLVDISPNSNPSSGTSINTAKKTELPTSLNTIKYEHVSCSNCVTGNLRYNQTTKLINPFGAKKAIEELESWRGSRAQITYRMADNHIVEIKILP